MFDMLEIRFVDIHGTLKAMNVPISATDMSNATKDPVFTEGVNIDGSSVTGFTPIEDSDLHLKPDPESLVELPYTERPKLAVMCKIIKNGIVFVGDTRSRLRKILNSKLGNQGWTLKVGPEPEFFLFDGIKPIDAGRYADIFPDAIAEGMIKRFSEHLTRLKFQPKVHHHEVGTGQTFHL
jgi:glutamine synthetase